MSQRLTLTQLFPTEWNQEMPATLMDLMSAEYEDLDETARALRALVVDVVHSHEREPVLTAEVALRLLERHHLPARRGKWVIVALNDERERVYTKVSGGGMKLLHTVSSAIPAPAKLAERVPLPEGGSYLVIFGGGPSVLAEDSLATSFRAVADTFPVSDLVLWEEKDDQATFWSVRAGKGQSGSMIYDFPDPDLTQRWWAV